MADFSIQTQTTQAPPLEKFNQIAKDLTQYFMVKKQMEEQKKQQGIDNAVKALSTLTGMYKQGIGGPELLSAAEPHMKTLGFGPINLQAMPSFKNMTKEQLIDMSQNHPSEEMRTRAKQNLDTMIQLEEKDVTPDMKNFEAENMGMKGKRNTEEYGKAFSAWRKEQLQQRGAGFAQSRPVTVFDTKTGKTMVKTLADIDGNPRYISTQDPNFVALKKNADYRRMNANYVNTISRYSNMAENIMKKYGLNQNPKFLNYTIQDIIKLRGMGSGDVAALGQIISGLQQEIAKVESGTLGISGAHVETAKQFSRGLNMNMPMKDLITVFQWAKQAGDERLNSIDQTSNQLKSDLGVQVDTNQSDPLGLR